VEGGK
jgi:hypothetical protein